MKDYQKILNDFYQKHNPEKLGQVEYLLNKYKGREEELVNSLKEKYAVTEEKVAKPEETDTLKKASRPDAPKQRVAAKAPGNEKSDAKLEWKKKREEILRKVKERADQLKKAKEETAKKVAPKTVIPPVTDPAKESVASKKEADVKPDLQQKDEEEMAGNARYSKEEEEKVIAEKISDYEGKAEQKKIYDKDEKEENSTEEKIEQKKEQKAEEKKTEQKASALPAVRQNIQTIEETYSVKGLMIGLTIVFLIFTAFLFFNPNQRNSITSKFTGLFENKDTQEKVAPKKKSGIDPQMIEAKDGSKTEEEPVAGEEEATTGGFESNLDEDDEDETVIPGSTDEPESQPSKPQKAIGLSGYIIGYSAIARETMASEHVSLLISNGFKAGYYWIPDYSPAGSKLFKVYVGPFGSEKEAEQTLPDVRRLNPQAYVMYLK